VPEPAATRTRRAATRGAALLLTAALGATLPAGCAADRDLKTPEVEALILDDLEGKYGEAEVGDARCPEEIPAKEGERFRCTARVGDAEVPYRVELTAIDGTTVRVAVDAEKIVFLTEQIEEFVREDLPPEQQGAEVRCGDAEVQLFDDGDTFGCTKLLPDGEQGVLYRVVDGTLEQL
jgi:hypothetical protein